MKKVIAIILLLLAAVIGVISYQVKEKNTQEEIYNEAAIFFQEEDYKKAIEYFEEAANHNNLFSGDLKQDLSCYQAEAHMKLGEYEAAIELYDAMIEESGKESIPYIMKAFCLVGMGEEDSAAAVYREGYEKTKDSEFLYYLANQYIAIEQYEEALHVIHTYQDTKDEEVGCKLAFLEIVVYEKQQQYDKAYELVNAYCEKYPDDEAGQKEKIFLETRQ